MKKSNNIWIDTKKWNLIYKVIKSFPYIKTKEAKDVIFENITWTLNHAISPKSLSSRHITNLVQGRVQSGKTTNFLSVAAGAFDQGYKIVLILGGTNATLLKQNLDNVKKTFNVLENHDIKVFQMDNIKKDCAEFIGTSVQEGKKIFIVIMKEFSHIQSTITALRQNSCENWPLLILDDEADINTVNLCSVSQSPLHKKIIELKNIFSTSSYVEYTGTPQSLLLGSNNNEMSPTFGNTIRTAEEYCGLETFHNEHSRNTINIDTLENICEYCYALYYFLYAVQMAAVSEDENYEFLVYSSHLVIRNHEIIKMYEKQLKKILNNEFDKELINKILHEENPFNLSEKTIKDKILATATQTQISALFGDSSEFTKDPLKKYHIYVGSKLLGRGVSFKNLLVEFLSTDTKIMHADNLLQKARWFGYRSNNRLKWLKIFATSRIELAFEDLRKSDNSTWAQIRLIRHSETSLRDSAIFFPSHLDYLLPTAPNKMQNSKKEIIKKGTRLTVTLDSQWDKSVSCLKTLMDFFILSHEIPITTDLLKLVSVIAFSEGNANLDIQKKEAAYVTKRDIIVHSRKLKSE